jgi:hypothetical protein
VKIPPILLEGDDSAHAPAGGTGRRYVLGPAPQVHPTPVAAALPESYGTGQLFLTARDPHWLYAHWDFSGAQIRKFNSLSADGHLILRVYGDRPTGLPISEIHLHPESRHWFVPAPQAGVNYSTTLGYYDSARKWVELACSTIVPTPSDTVAESTGVRFVTVPADEPLTEWLSPAPGTLRMSEITSLAVAPSAPRTEGDAGTPRATGMPGSWTPEQEKALATVLKFDEVPRMGTSSIEAMELARRQPGREAPAPTGGAAPGGPLMAGEAAWALESAPDGGALGGVSSPSGQPGRPRGFWFNVNAELIVYGATEPGATVTIGGRQIQLRPDGSFSFRFALPDGSYDLRLVALSADAMETRQADLFFSRASEYQGGVTPHPQDETLPPPPSSAEG